ncbi:MAG: ABC transporter permease [Saprospiraceae bacterium]
MNKLGLIISREYITKVKNKNFIITTLLTPLGFLVFFIVIGIIFSYEGSKTYRIAISDKSEMDFKLPENTKKFTFVKSSDPFDSLKAMYLRGELDGILVLPKFAGVDVKAYTVFYYADKAMDIEIESSLENFLEDGIRNYKINLMSLQKEQLDKLQTDISIDPEPVSATEKDRSAYTSKIATFLGGAMGYVIFFIIFLYGASVMRSVADEKVNRIVEVIISSAKPIDLMLGKVIGVGLVGLTQILIWVILIPIIYIIGMSIAGIDVQQLQEASQSMSQQQPVDGEELANVLRELGNLNWLKIAFLFVFYFIGGYFIYASMFAAIGAAVGDDINDAQSLTILVTIPILLAMYVMFQAIRLPDSSLAIFSSLFPLFSPIVMPALLAFDPPCWQIICSLILLFAFSYFMIWMAARIYRTGILMYGKKASVKEIAKWIWRG